MASRKIAALAAISLLASGSAAIAQSAQPLSLANAPSVQRAGASLDDANGARRRGAVFYIVGAIVLGLVVWGVIQLTDGNDPDSP